METFQVRIINPKAKKILDNLADLKLITMQEGDESLFPLTALQKKSISLSKKQVREGQFKHHKDAMIELSKWLKKK